MVQLIDIQNSPITKLFEDTGTKLFEAIDFEETIKSEEEINQVLGINITSLIFIVYKEKTLEFIDELKSNAKKEYPIMMKILREKGNGTKKR